MISYNVIVGDTFSMVLPHIFGNFSQDAGLSFVTSRKFCIAITTIFLSLPLSLYK